MPREELEVIISYDRELEEWHYYGDVPTLNRKWRDNISPQREIVEENGQITLLEGTITGNVIIQKKRVMTSEQKKRVCRTVEKKSVIESHYFL